MRFNKHWNLEGSHAYFGASKYHWIRYDDSKMQNVFMNQFESQLGNRKHAWAAEAINLGLRQAKTKKTLNMYINDAIGFGMTPEVTLYFSSNFFGTADAISFDEQTLRVSDLRTGKHPASFDQTLIYCALFCHEYGLNPYDIEMIMRIYQNDEILELVANPEDVRDIMDKMKRWDPIIEDMKERML